MWSGAMKLRVGFSSTSARQNPVSGSQTRLLNSSMVTKDQTCLRKPRRVGDWSAAWELGISRTLVAVNHDLDTDMLFTIDVSRRRKSITGAREALSGYQKGHCFYCFCSFSLLGPEPPDVDHFFPHSLKVTNIGGNIDGLWNLVLACPGCNRGVDGKSNRVPVLTLLERLSKRNEFLISSQHPLRETLIRQTGANESERRHFLNEFHREALAVLIHEWETDEVMEPLF